MKRLLHILSLMLAMVIALPALAQTEPSDSVSQPKPANRRFITPVKPETNVTLLPGKDVDEKMLEQYLTGDTAKAAAEARRDSIKKAYTRYPKLNDLTVGFNFIDLVLAAAGQDYFNADFSLTLNMWNRLQPVFELGVGRAKSTPDDKNFTYNGKFAPFVRLGVNYNFLFKSNPDYQALLGVRLGGSIFKYDVTGIRHHNGYWNEDATTEILGQTGRALWMEAVAGLKVKIWREWSLGWQVKYHSILGENKTKQGKPWFIPGYGTRSGSIGFSFNVYYTIPMHKPAPVEENTSIAEPQS